MNLEDYAFIEKIATEGGSFLMRQIDPSTLKEHETPDFVRKAIKAIIQNPERFGSKTIRTAVEVLAPYLRDLGGTVSSHIKYFEEPSEAFANIFQISASSSLYDPNIFFDVQLSFEGIKSKDGDSLDSKTVDMIKEKFKKHSSPLVVIPAGTTLSLTEELFRSYNARFGVAYNYCFPTRDVGLGTNLKKEFSLGPREPQMSLRDSLYFRFKPNQFWNEILFHCRDADPDICKNQFAVIRKGLNLSFMTDEKGPAYSPYQSYRCAVSRDKQKGLVSVTNQGPGYLPLFLHEVPKSE